MKKILLVLLTITSLSAFCIEKPKYQLGGSVAYSIENVPGGADGVDTSIFFDATWKHNLKEKLDLTYGARGTLDVAVSTKSGEFQGTNISLIGSGLVGLEYNLKENLDLYTQLELGIGPRFFVNHKNNNVSTNTNISFITAGKYVSKAILGLKYKEYKVGIFSGYGKGTVGLEFGYEF